MELNKEIYNNTINISNKNEIKSDNKNGFIYILQLREFIKTKEQIYKIGMTNKNDFLTRFKQYPKKSKYYKYWKVPDAKEYERIVIIKFKKKFKQINDIGSEYFEGDIYEMINTIDNLVEILGDNIFN